MKWWVLFLTILYPVLNYYIYSIYYDKQQLWKKREKQSPNPYLESFKILEKLAISLCVIYAVYSVVFLSVSETSMLALATGSLVSIIGLALLYYSRREIGENFSPCHCAHLPNKYISTGPYKYFRHPIYVANILTFIGIVIFNFSFLMILAFFCLLIYYCFAVYGENRNLKEEFPDAFPNQFIYRKLKTDSDFKNFTEQYKLSCSQRNLILNYEPNPKEFADCDKVIGVYRNGKLLAGYVLNFYPKRSLQTQSESEQKNILDKLDGSYCEIVSIWHSTEVSRLEFGLQLWPMIVWDTVCMGTKYIFGCSMKGHRLKGLYTFFGPNIVVDGKEKDDLIAFYFSKTKFVTTFMAAFVLTIPKAILKKRKARNVTREAN